MKDKITRLKFNRDQEYITDDQYKIFWNADEDGAQLEIAIHDESPGTVIDTGADKKTKLLEQPRTFYYKVNNNAVTELSFQAKDVILKSQRGKKDAEAVYQFPLSYNLFNRDRNIVTLYAQQEGYGSGTVGKVIGTIKFFAEAEDNFVNVKLNRPGTDDTSDKKLWGAIKNHSLRFADYENFIDRILCKDEAPIFGKDKRAMAKTRSPFIRSEEYNLIKFATDFYMLYKFGLDPNELQGYLGASNKLPYYDLVIQRIKDDLKFDDAKAVATQGNDCDVREQERLSDPFMVELIWSYWMEQGMLVQTLNVINLRFQNIKGNLYLDKLQRFDVDPLRPLSHILWGYIQDEQHRLSLPRRVNEYDHEYGLVLTGKAVPRLNAVDSRVQFLEAFHNLLNLCTVYFRESDDTTRIADAFPILNSLREVHLLLAEGNHNAYGNLTWTARQEMMMQQYLLSRSEMREFLGGKVMVPYPETWMDRVDTMRNIQGWGTVGIVHYYELAVHGELILLSIRYGNWSDVTLDRNNAANWAQEFRNSVQRYIHAYRAVTGVDLSVEQIQSTGNFAIQPAYLIQQRMLTDRARTKRA